MIIAYSGRSRPSATALSATDDNITIIRASNPPSDINWGRAVANSKLNPDISNTTNKRRMRELFKEHNVPTPKLFHAREVGLMVTDYGQTTHFIGRPDRHTKGRGFWKIANRGDLRKAMHGTSKKKAATHFMEYISKEQAPREYRVHIFLGKSIRISEKDFSVIGETSHGLYTTRKPTHPVAHVREAAKKAVAAVGLDFGCVDILANDEECWVTEVNAAPGLGGTLPQLYVDTFKKWKISNG